MSDAYEIEISNLKDQIIDLEDDIKTLKEIIESLSK